VGTGSELVTVTVADWLVVPPMPVQLRMKFVLAVSVPVDCEPLVVFVPLQPPEAVQLDAFVALHVSVDIPPLVIDVGLAPSET